MNYPSLRDNNTLRRVLVNEVMFWAEKLKKRFVEKMAEKHGAEHPAAVGAEMEGESAGERHNVWHTYMTFYVLIPIKSVCPLIWQGNVGQRWMISWKDAEECQRIRCFGQIIQGNSPPNILGIFLFNSIVDRM